MDHEEKCATAEESQSPTILSRLWDPIKDQWFLIVLVVLVIFSSQIQVPEAQQDLKSRIVQNLTIAVIFFINGLATQTGDLVANIRRWRCHVFIQVVGFVFTSLTMFGVVAAIATNQALMDPLLLNGLVVLGCLPTAFSINTVMTRKAKGNATLTLTESVIGNAIGPFLSSMLVLGYTSIDIWYTEGMPTAAGGLGKLLQRVFAQFGLTLILPLAIGQLVQHFFSETVKKLLHDYHFIKFGPLSLLVLIWSGYDSAFASHAFADVEKTQIIGVIVICVSLFLLWMLVTIATSVAFLGREDAVAAAFCIPTKSPALGIPLATILFAGMSAEDTAKVYIPLVIFQFVQTCLSNLATIPLRRWRAKAACPTDSNKMSDSDSLA
ncbi:sodium bile acid symporter family protein [Apiospora phragmitis]|uniref:Sodium bile acid symporter family protein n=1 Tax=Apiospora phragmitis TaxID=2905665 RepID=A0ABR1V0I4_9PEZI